MANNTLKILFICFIANLFNVRADKASFFQRNFDVLHRDPFPTPAKSRASVQSLWIEQKLDHFDENNKHTWKMPYMANEELFQKGGPVFIYVGGEWDISPGPISSGHLYDMAKEHKGYLFYTEHRYYGDSHPTSDLAVENLKYLNIKQALADLAHFIRTMKATIPGMANSKVILAGGSYAGTMVTWFKKLYPDLAVGCWASSAPLFAELNFYKYKEVAGQSILNIGGQDCYKRIQNGIFELESMVANKRAAEVKAMLKLCNNFDETNDLDVWTLFGEIAGHFAGLAQYHNGGDIQKVCKKVMEGGDDDAIAVAKYIASQLSTKKCTDLSYEESLSNMKKLEWSDSMERQWFYQTCNEYGWYQTSSSRKQPFGTKFPLEHYIQICSDVFGKKYTNEFIENRIIATNYEFGGYTPNVDDVYWSHGDLDPWHSLGVLNGDMVTVIPMHAHCKDFKSINDSDTAEMRASKERIAELVRLWIGEAKKNSELGAQ